MPLPTDENRFLLKTENPIDHDLIKKQNLVLTVVTNGRLNLTTISQRFPECTRKQPDNLSAAVIRFQIPPDKKKISCNIFGSGKIVSTGSKNFYNALSCIHITLRKIRKATHSDIKGVSISLKNIVMTMKLPCRIDLVSFARENFKFCVYNPKKFPGVIMSLPGSNKPVANVFGPGSIVIPGPAEKDYAIECCAFVYEKVKNYQILEDPYTYKKIKQEFDPFFPKKEIMKDKSLPKKKKKSKD